MKQKHLYSLIDRSYTTIEVVFPEDLEKAEEAARAVRKRFNDETIRGAFRTYTYKSPLACCVAAGDHVVVDTPSSGLRVVYVVAVHAQPEIDLDANHDYKWIVQRVDLSVYNDLNKREAEFKATMLEVERTRQREEVVASMLQHLPQGSEARAKFDAALARLNPWAAPIARKTPPWPVHDEAAPIAENASEAKDE